MAHPINASASIVVSYPYLTSSSSSWVPPPPPSSTEVAPPPPPPPPSLTGSCTHTYTAHLDGAGEYALAVSLPTDDLRLERDVTYKYAHHAADGGGGDATAAAAAAAACDDAVQHCDDDGGGATLATVVRSLHLLGGAWWAAGGVAGRGEAWWLDTVYLAPSERPARRVRGVVSAALPRHAGAFAAALAAGVVRVSLHAHVDSRGSLPACDGCEVAAAADGSFAMEGAVAPGMYTLRASSADGGFDDGGGGGGKLRIASWQQTNVLYSEQHAHLAVVTAATAAASGAAAAAEALLVLRWDARQADLGLQLAFAYDAADNATAATAATTPRCEVWSGRPVCGGATWEASDSGGSEVVAVDGWAAAEYSAVVLGAPRLCHGYGLASSAALPGGSASVDCIGNCVTGRGYCYATASRLCANCVLWEPRPHTEEVLCSDHGEAQGGTLPRTAEWDADPSCDATRGGEAVTACANLTRAAASLELVVQGEPWLKAYLPTGAPPPSSPPTPFGSFLCLSPHTDPLGVLSTPALLDALSFVALAEDGASSCAVAMNATG